MKKLCWLLLCFLATNFTAFCQDYSNKGKDFWIGYGNHVRMFNAGEAEKMQVYITSDVDTKGTLEIPGIGASQPFVIIANQITTIDISRNAALWDEGKYATGIHIVSELPVVVYSYIYINAMSGATLCLPTNVLGTEYFSVNFTQISNEPNSYSYFFAVATEDNTSVIITPSGKTKSGMPANVPFTVSLNKGEIYQVLGAPGVDLTGSKIQSVNSAGGGTGCKKIAVFCGSGKISIGCGGPATSDNLYQQIYPKNSWGKKYVTAPSTSSGGNYQVNYYRVIRPDDKTIVKVNGQVISTALFENNFYYEFSNNTTNVIEADKPIFLAQYFTSQGCSGNGGNGDPEMIYLNPVEQTINKVTLNSMQPSSGTNINQHYINVILANKPSVINSFQIDGTSYADKFLPIDQDNGYAYARIQISRDAHTVTCDSGFNAIAYGFGQYESYGYSAGSNLRDLYQFVTISNKYATVNIPATCKDAPFFFHIVFPYQPSSIQWGFNGLFKDTTISNPVSDSNWVVNGKTLYRYKLDKEYSVNDIGSYPIKVYTDNPTVDGCTGIQEINFNLEVYLKPTVSFEANFSGCLYDSIHFTDKTTSERQIQKWSWDLGDGTFQNKKDFSYLYKNPKSYTVKFSTLNDIGCFSDTATKVIEIDSLPITNFNIPPINCANDSVLFTNNSSLPPGRTGKFYWDFGDGSSTIIDGIHDLKYKYSQEKTYNATLYSITEKGCKSNVVSRSVKINYTPQVDFILPDVCLSDKITTFQNTSTIGDNSQSQFNYLWNFGDASNATPTNPDSSVAKDGVHSYTRADHYEVNLKVTSKDGCIADSTKTFTVNGANPNAQFSVNNENTLCSNQSVNILDASSVDFGKITKVEIYWDNANDITKTTFDDNPSVGKEYTHLYDDFGSPVSKNYNLVYTAYSGVSCLNTFNKTITVLASPQLVVNPITPICAEKSSILLQFASETAGLPGVGIYSGPGVNNPMFTPSSSLVGNQTLSYLYTANNTCKASITQDIVVLPTPQVDAGPDRTLLEGNSIILNATASGNNLQFLWSPAMGITPIDSLNPSVSISDDLLYTLKVTSSDGCTANDNVFIKVLKEVKVPNAFSPNGDNINDTWQIKYLDSYPNAEVSIFNRYGQLVYRSIGYAVPWDGTYLGKPLPMGTYYYIINPKNGRAAMNGSITIIR